jgi:hypothetical protein
VRIAFKSWPYILFWALSVLPLRAEVTVTATPLIPPQTAEALSESTILHDIEQKSKKVQRAEYVKVIDFSANNYELQKKKTWPQKHEGLTLKKKRKPFVGNIKN